MKPTVVWKPDAYLSLKVAVQSKTELETTAQREARLKANSCVDAKGGADVGSRSYS